MKKLLSFLAILITFTMYSQNAIDESLCVDCKIPCMCQLYYNTYLKDPVKRATIKRNWNDFFAEDLSAFHQYQSGANVVNIKFDGLGCIYPENNSELQNIKTDFLGENEKDYRRFYKHSFYHLYNQQQLGNSNAKIDAFIKAEGIPNTFTKIQRAWYKGIIPNWKKDIDYFEFIKTWNNKHLQDKIDEIDKKIKAANFKKIVFFIHGYNVPYSLAVFQGKIMLDKILESDNTLKASDILLINVFWPSGNRKYDRFNENDCDYNNIENPKTIVAFTYYSNRAYLSAIFLRRIIRKIKYDKPIDIITHSHGSTLATTALINTTKKVQPGPLSERICDLMEKEPFPDKEINVFLNAPSIPGILTFIDLTNTPEQLKYRFFVGYNTHDLVLNKQKIKVNGQTIKSIAPSGFLSSTTLGCNKNNEVANTISMLKAKKLDQLFKADINSTQNEHDFFCYVKQKEFKSNLKLFLSGKFR